MPPALVRAMIAAVAVLITVVAQWTATPGISTLGNELLRDTFLRIQRTDAPDSRILVVDIDETSTAQLGPWPWPRSRVAELVEVLLSYYKVKAVALDIVMPEAADNEGDKRLALLSANAPVVLAQAFDFQTQRPTPLLAGMPGGNTVAYATTGVPATGYIANHPALAAGSKIGSIGIVPDSDGVLRRVPLLTTFDGKSYAALSLELINCCNGHGPLPLADTGYSRIAYTRDWTAYTVATANEILKQEYAENAFENRLVLIGSSSMGQGDRVVTPLGSSRPGLGVQAAMLTTLLDRQAGTAPTPWRGALLASAFTLVTAVLAMFAFHRLPAISSVGLLAMLSALWISMAYVAAPHDPNFVTTSPLFSNLFLLAFAVPYQWQLAQQRSRHLLNTLRQYVAPDVVAELLQSKEDDPLKPRLLDVTTMIADMEGYTTQVELLSMEEAAKLTRDFLECLTGPVFSHHGTLDKYTGDGLVAFWGAPLPLEQHADMALDAAREILRRVDELSRQRVLAGLPPLRVRIGIESGPAMAGDFGTSLRSIYTAVGDSVNTASRLEQAARDFPHDVIIGAGTVERARRHRFILLGERLLRGKEKTTHLYTFEPSVAAAAAEAIDYQASPAA